MKTALFSPVATAEFSKFAGILSAALSHGPGNRGHSACGPTHVAPLEFPRETGLTLRGAGKARNPFQTTQGSLQTEEEAGLR